MAREGPRTVGSEIRNRLGQSVLRGQKMTGKHDDLVNHTENYSGWASRILLANRSVIVRTRSGPPLLHLLYTNTGYQVFPV